jgi:exodeoxyribonuclease-5
VWQPESIQVPAVQVLGIYEAAGMEFDAIWICGMDASQWPAPGRPSPFISRELQARYAMPDATPGATVEFARKVLSRLVSSAAECVISWARSQGDSELTASPLLDGIDAEAYDGPGDPGRFLASLAGPNLSPAEEDDQPPAVAEDERVRGGAYTVQRQMTEPLAAFVFGRLGFRPLEPVVYGLSPGVRGNIIHEALHSLLADRPTSDEIIAWDAQQLTRRAGAAVDSALAPHFAHADALLHSLLVLERRRLTRLLEEFIRAESSREPFSVVAVERELDYRVSGVELGLRIDRIDRLDDGRLAIIDYKTGAPRGFFNQQREPADWQLVVYADALDEPVGALVLMNIDSRAITSRGAGSEWSRIDDWQETLAQWRSTVHRAIEELRQGDVRMNTRQPVADGRQLGLLSRLEEYRSAD